MIFNRSKYTTSIALASAMFLVACSDSDSDSDTDTGANTDNDPVDVLLFDEATDGDIINDPNNPQFLQFAVGQNRLNAAVVAPDLDYITVNIPAGSQLTSIQLDDYSSLDDQSFIAIQTGSVFTVPADAPAVEDLLGYLHFGEDMIDTDILTGIGLGNGAQGFTPPLEAGDYSFWIQETGGEPVNFSLNFVVEPSL